MTDSKPSGRSGKTVVIAGGGTGGHIYPGLAVARALSARGYDVHWVGARGGLEEKLVPREGVPLHVVAIGKLHASAGIWVRLKTLLGMPLAFLQSLRLALQLRPVAVLGVGGFASGPFLFLASLLRFRTVIWEPNAHAGMANRLLAPLVTRCLSVFDEAARDLSAGKTFRVGLPVRASMQMRAREPLTGRPFRLLVFGGSQGARPINRVVLEMLEQAVRERASWLETIEIVHQTGPYDFAEAHARYQALAKPGLQCLEYLHDMDQRYQWADLVLCRAGASTVAEIAACGKAALFVPLPTAADNHQLKNAQAMVRAGAGLVLEQKDISPSALAAEIQRLMHAPAEVARLEQAAARLASPNAVQDIAEHLLGDFSRPREIGAD